MAQKCQAKTTSGRDCRAWAGTSGYCFQHDPDRATERARARRKGGRASAALRALGPVEISAVGDWLPVLVAVANDVLGSEKRPCQRARAICQIAKTYYELSVASELEARIEALENGTHYGTI